MRVIASRLRGAFVALPILPALAIFAFLAAPALGQSVTEISTIQAGTNILYDVGFHPDSVRIASAGYDATVKIWDSTDTSLLLTLTPHSITAQCVTFSQDGLTAASGDSGSAVRLWDIGAGGTPLDTIATASPVVEDVDISPDGTLLATANNDNNTATIWDITSVPATLVYTLPHAGIVDAVKFSPDGSLLATASRDGTVKLWYVTDGLEHSTLNDHTTSPSMVAFSPDGTLVASQGGTAGTINVWSVSTGGVVTTLTGASGGALAYHPSGAFIASRDTAGTSVKIWTVATATELISVPGHPGTVTAVDFSPDGLRLVSGDSAGTLKTWDVSGLEGPSVTILAPVANAVLASGTSSTSLTVSSTGHPAPGHWHWQLGTPFADSGAATGTEVPAGTFTDTIPNLLDGQTYTVYVALVDDATTGDALVDAITYPTSRASVTFSVATGGTPTDAVTVSDAQGSAGDVVAISVGTYDTPVAGHSVTGIDLTVTYDPTILTPTSDVGGVTAATLTTLTTGWTVVQNVLIPFPRLASGISRITMLMQTGRRG